jgi:hypothetical protein
MLISRLPLLNGRMMNVKVVQPVICCMNWIGLEENYSTICDATKCYFKRRTWEGTTGKNQALLNLALNYSSGTTFILLYFEKSV